jgi:hypothetical protein
VGKSVPGTERRIRRRASESVAGLVFCQPKLSIDLKLTLQPSGEIWTPYLKLILLILYLKYNHLGLIII